MTQSLVWRYELSEGEQHLVIVQEPRHDTLTASVMGDPLPGRSALDRIPAPPVAPTQAPSPRRGSRNAQPLRSPRELRRMKAMAARHPIGS
jgi:hypothetical protein